MKTHYFKKIANLQLAIATYENLIERENDENLKEALTIILDGLTVAKKHYEDMYKAVPQQMESDWIDVKDEVPEDGVKVICKGIRGGCYLCEYKDGKFIEVGRKRVCKVKSYVHIPE